MSAKKEEKSFGDLPTLGHVEKVRTKVAAGDGPSWTALGLSKAETLKPPMGAEEIVDDGRTDGARRWKAGEEILGRYMVEGELGQGGMGVVYECLDKVGGVRVAVKGLPPELSHDSAEMEEVRENFRLVGDLRHPCIAGVRTLEKDERGEFYLVMDLAEGESLRKWERSKWKACGVSLAEAVGVLRQVASALDYAHGRKIIHRDVKPGNVMIDGKGEVKVLDFGLADQIRTSLSRASHAYRGTSGTGPYMSPEQWRGQPQDGKTDQYALGVMAYEMLAGRLPFGSSDMGVLREIVLKEEPPAIRGLPSSAMAAVRRAMAKRAEVRFGSCGEFVEALEGKRKAGLGKGQGQKADCEGRGTGENVFLLKVRLGKALSDAGKEEMTSEERAALGKVTELYDAGVEALRAEQMEVAEDLLAQAERAMESWWKSFAARQAEEQREEVTRRARNLQKEFARLEAERRAEEKRLELERQEEAEAARLAAIWREKQRREEAERKEREEQIRREGEKKALEEEERRAEEWDARVQEAEAELKLTEAIKRWENRARRAKVTGVLALVVALGCGGIAIPGLLQGTILTTPAAKALGQGTHAGEEKTIPLGRNAQMTFVWCPPGGFMMGDSEGRMEEQRRVILHRGFWMAKYEVTQGQWESVMGTNPSDIKGENLPVARVSWDDAREFCRKTGLRLPREEEWEYACRAGSKGPYAGDLENMGWYSGNSEGQVHPVGKMRANAWGLHDMHGNVSEWCANLWTFSPGCRVLRGGSWNYSDAGCRSGHRDYGSKDYRFRDSGFRPCASSGLL